MIPIPDFPDYYACSDGQIWSGKSNKCLTPRPDRSGYLRVNLTVDGKHSTQPVHKLIAAAYLGPAEGRHVLHGPNGPGDNSVGNLRYGTRNENMQDRYHFGVAPREAKAGVIEGFVPVLSEADVADIRHYALAGRTDTQIAEWFCIPTTSVRGIVEGWEGAYNPL